MRGIQKISTKGMSREEWLMPGAEKRSAALTLPGSWACPDGQALFCLGG